MSNNTVTTSNGVGFGSLLALLFIGLKLGNVIAWSWWWVLSPFWIPLVLVVIMFVVVMFFVLLANGISSFFANRAATKRMKAFYENGTK